MLYSSLLKRGTTCVTDEKVCLVDTNELIAKKLENYHKNREEQGKSGFVAGLHARELEVVENAEADENLMALLGEEQAYTEPVYTGPSAEELLADAREQIFKMEDEARTALEAERKRVLEAAREEGYAKGFAEGQQQGIAQADGMKRELAAEKAGIIAEYSQRMEELEPRFIELLTGIYEHLFNVELGEYRDLIIHLISSAMNQVDGARDYLIHVSKEDYSYVIMQKKEILDNAMVGNATMEIIEDISLHKNECLIETEGGIFDCGLGTQLSELTRKLKLLSYEKE